MTSLEARAQAALLAAIAELEARLTALGDAIVADAGRPAWVDAGSEAMDARPLCAAFLAHLDYSDELAPGGTRRLQGLIGSSAAVLERVAAVNAGKTGLHELLMCLDAGVLEPPRGEPTQRQWTASLLEAIGRPRFNRRQAVRSLTALEEAPVAASYFWGRVRKIVRISRDQAQRLLEKRLAVAGDLDPSLRLQMESLLRLPPDEPLAQVQQLKEYPRVNLVFPRPGGWVRKQVMAASPIFYPADLNSRAPEIIPLPDVTRKRRRLRRQDLAIEIRPFLPAIRVHRYLKPRPTPPPGDIP